MADYDLALGRIIDGLSHLRFSDSTAVFVLEVDAQDGPDHVDSHRSVLLVMSPWARAGVHHRWANTTDVIATMADLLHLGSLSQFDYYGAPLRDIWRNTPELSPYDALMPAVPLDKANPVATPEARASSQLDLEFEDRNDDSFSRLLWPMIKGERVPYPGATRQGADGADWGAGGKGTPSAGARRLDTNIVEHDISVMKNVTLSIDDELARWARVRAAALDISVSRMLSDLLRDMMQRENRYQTAMERHLNREPTIIAEPGTRYPGRAELHERTDLR